MYFVKKQEFISIYVCPFFFFNKNFGDFFIHNVPQDLLLLETIKIFTLF